MGWKRTDRYLNFYVNFEGLDTRIYCYTSVSKLDDVYKRVLK